MKRFFYFTIYLFLKFLLWFRYRVTVKGLENINPKTLNKPGGVLFLPNHSSVFVDPAVISAAVWFKYPLRPVIVEYMYYVPGIHMVMKFMNALPMPNNEVSTNSLKRKRSEKTVHNLVEALRNGDNFLIYPAGRLKDTPVEVVGGASAVHNILQALPNTNVVLVRTSGLYGSIFSKAFTGRTPPFFPTFWKGVKIALKNLLLFTPRRKVTVEFLPAPADFPVRGTRMEINKYLENWYNYPEGPKTKQPGEAFALVPYTFWSKELPKIEKKHAQDEEIDLSAIPEEVQEKVISKLSDMTEFPKESIKPEMDLSSDLGLDSLDMSEFVVYLQDQFDVRVIPTRELTTVAKAMALAAKQFTYAEEEEEEIETIGWKKPAVKKKAEIAEGKTIPEVFLNRCAQQSKEAACADLRSGVLTYGTLKLRVILLAEIMRKLPGDHIGILLPASVAATVSILAAQLAGKVPVLINWTVGSRHLESVVKLSGIQCVLTSWSFVDRLVNVDLSPIEDHLLMFEDIRREMGLKDKLQAWWRSKKSTKSLLHLFQSDKKDEKDTAVLLFTSGTESQPKGVPLSHRNILSNLKSICATTDFYNDDVFFGILPPFHSFGLTASSLFGLLSGMRVAYSPDPTEGKKLAKGIERWGATVTCGAPTFLKKILRSATPEQLKTLRFLVTGAEKAPQDLFQLAEELGIGNTIFEGYGVTECSPVLTCNRPGVPAFGVGQPLPGVEVIIVNPETEEIVPTGSQGMIIARGPNVFSGYLNKDVKPPFITIQGESWYLTGDLGFLDELGRLTISGRLKRFIKVGAEMISLGAIEDALIEIAPKKGWALAEEAPSIAVCGREIPDEKPKIAVFTRFPVTLDEINKALRELGFSNLVKISLVKELQELPLMGTGKIHYRQLEASHFPPDWLGEANKGF